MAILYLWYSILLFDKLWHTRIQSHAQVYQAFSLLDKIRSGSYLLWELLESIFSISINISKPTSNLNYILYKGSSTFFSLLVFCPFFVLQDNPIAKWKHDMSLFMVVYERRIMFSIMWHPWPEWFWSFWYDHDGDRQAD